LTAALIFWAPATVAQSSIVAKCACIGASIFVQSTSPGRP
jgi:hypothetical protein